MDITLAGVGDAMSESVAQLIQRLARETMHVPLGQARVHIAKELRGRRPQERRTLERQVATERSRLLAEEREALIEALAHQTARMARTAASDIVARALSAAQITDRTEIAEQVFRARARLRTTAEAG